MASELEAAEAEARKQTRIAEMADQMAAIHEEARWQERQNAMLLYRTLSRHAPSAIAEIKDKLYQSTNEYDKVRSDMIRTVEHLEADLARTNALLDGALQWLTDNGYRAAVVNGRLVVTAKGA